MSANSNHESPDLRLAKYLKGEIITAKGMDLGAYT